MADPISHKTNALNNLHRLHSVDLVIFVEGDDDIEFWKYRFSYFSDIPCKIKLAGGKEGIKDKIDKIINEDARILVACDKDHSNFLKDIDYHERIIRTYGYSIENTMYCPVVISEIIRKRLRLDELDKTPEINDWYRDFENSISELLKYDIANHKYNKGKKVFGDKCSRFLKNNGHSPYLCNKKIEDLINILNDSFDESEISEVTKEISLNTKDKRFLVKGHFLTSAVRNILKKLIGPNGRDSFSDDVLYELTVDACKMNCECLDIIYLKNSIKLAMESILAA